MRARQKILAFLVTIYNLATNDEIKFLTFQHFYEMSLTWKMFVLCRYFYRACKLSKSRFLPTKTLFSLNKWKNKKIMRLFYFCCADKKDLSFLRATLNKLFIAFSFPLQLKLGEIFYSNGKSRIPLKLLEHVKMLFQLWIRSNHPWIINLLFYS